MNVPDLSSLQKVDTEYWEFSIEIKKSYRGDWDDAVHRSYDRFVKNVEQNAAGIRAINGQARQIIKTAASLGVERLSKHADELYREADSI